MNRLRIVFHGPNASQFRPGMEELIGSDHEIQTLSDRLDLPGERSAFEAADVIIGIRLQADLPRPQQLKLPGASGGHRRHRHCPAATGLPLVQLLWP